MIDKFRIKTKKTQIMIQINEDYLETHFDVVEFITDHLTAWSGDDDWSVILKKHKEQGSGGMYILAKQWTDEFQENYDNVTWGEDLEYYDTLEEFLTNKNK